MLIFARNASQSVTDYGIIFDDMIRRLPFGFQFSPDKEKEQLLMLKHAYIIKLKYCEEMKDAQSTIDLKEFTDNIAQFIVRCHNTRDNFDQAFVKRGIFKNKDSDIFTSTINNTIDTLRKKYGESHDLSLLDAAVEKLNTDKPRIKPKL